MEFINQLSYLGGPTLWGVSPYRKTSLNSYKWNEITPIASWSIIYIYIYTIIISPFTNC
jgi:hypothetical protein